MERSSDRLDTVERVTPDECKQELQEALRTIEEKLNSSYVNLIKILQTSEYPVSRLTTALHTFGTEGKSTQSLLLLHLKKQNGGKYTSNQKLLRGVKLSVVVKMLY